MATDVSATCPSPIFPIRHAPLMLFASICALFVLLGDLGGDAHRLGRVGVHRRHHQVRARATMRRRRRQSRIAHDGRLLEPVAHAAHLLDPVLFWRHRKDERGLAGARAAKKSRFSHLWRPPSLCVFPICQRIHSFDRRAQPLLLWLAPGVCVPHGSPHPYMSRHQRTLGMCVGHVSARRILRLFFDIWEKWGRHIWEKGVLGST